MTCRSGFFDKFVPSIHNLPMKKIFIALYTTALLLASCEKNDPEDQFPVYFPGDTSTGQIWATKSQTDWTASVRAVYHANDPNYLAFLANTYTSEGDLRESLEISFMPLDTGTYAIDRISHIQPEGGINAYYATTRGDGDAAEDYYLIDTTATDNYLRLVKSDTVTGEFEGFFTCTFVVDTKFGPKINRLHPNKIKFSNGHFKFKVN